MSGLGFKCKNVQQQQKQSTFTPQIWEITLLLQNQSTNTQKIATIKVNVIISPFQFYHGLKINNDDQFQRKLNEKFIQISPKYRLIMSDEEQQKLIALNRKLKDRYTPIFHQNAGVKGMGKLMSIRQFQEKWKEVYGKSFANKMKGWDRKLQILLQKLRIFDIICYHSLLAYVYQSIESIDHIVMQNYSFRYECMMEEIYSLFRKQQDNKIGKIVDYIKLRKLDIVFLQEVSMQNLWSIMNKIPNYRVSHQKYSSQKQKISAIMISQNLIQHMDHQNITFKMMNTQYFHFWNHQQNKKVKQLSQIYQSTPSKKYSFLNHNMNSLPYQNPIRYTTIKVPRNGRKQLPKIEEQYIKGKKLKNQLNLISNEKNSKKRRQNQIVYNMEDINQSQTLKIQNQMRIIRQAEEMLGTEQQINPQVNQQKFNKTFDSAQKLKNNISQTKLQGKEHLNIINVKRKNLLTELDADLLNFSQKGIIQFLGNLILICDSMQKQGERQEQKIKKISRCLQILKQKYPQHTIIMGLDIDIAFTYGHSLNTTQICSNNMYKFPKIVSSNKKSYRNWKILKGFLKNEGLFTTNYMKTNFQLDRGQVDVSTMDCNNLILSTNEYKRAWIQNCNGKGIKINDKLPREEHPFINYFVYGEISHDIKIVNF